MKKSFESYRDLMLGLFFMFLSAAYFSATYLIKVKNSAMLGGGRFFPRCLGIAAFVVSLIVAYNGYKTYSHSQSENQEERKFKNYKRVILSLFLLCLYAFLLNLVGFLVSTIIYQFFQISLIANKEDRKIIKIAIISIFTGIITYLLFGNLFGIILPRGILF